MSRASKVTIRTAEQVTPAEAAEIISRVRAKEEQYFVRSTHCIACDAEFDRDTKGIATGLPMDECAACAKISNKAAASLKYDPGRAADDARQLPGIAELADGNSRARPAARPCE